MVCVFGGRYRLTSFFSDQPLAIIPVQVFGRGPPPQRNLDDEEIAAVLTYVRNAWGNQGYPVTQGMVSDLRKETAARDRPWTDHELELTEH